MIKIHYQHDQEELFARCGGHMTELIETDRGVKSAASQAIGRDVLERFRPDKDHFLQHVIGMGDYETYGCFFEGAPVRVFGGLKPIEDVKVGDMVLTGEGLYKPVSATFTDHYDGVAVELGVRGMPSAIKATANHPFYVVPGALLKGARLCRLVNKNGEQAYAAELESASMAGEYKAARDIEPGDFLRIPIPQGCKRNIVMPPYLLGLYLAEGCCSNEYKDIATKGEAKGMVLVLNHDTDTGPIARMCKDLESKGRSRPTESVTNSSEYTTRYDISWKEGAMEAEELVGRHSTRKFIHPDIFAQDADWIMDFLAGYLDGDGCHSPSKDPRKEGVVIFSTASEALALDLQLLFAKQGMPVSICKNWNLNKNGCFGKEDKPIWHGSIGSSYSNKILLRCERLKPHGKEAVNRGQSSIKTTSKYVLVKVSASVKYTTSQTRFNLEVDGVHSYVVYVDVHNSNRNADAFTKKANSENYGTFVKYGHFYREHRHTSPDLAIGSIKYAAYNELMARIELLLWGHKKKAAAEYEAAKAGEELHYSMACRIHHDVCSICSHEAKSPALWCSHMKQARGQYMPEHKKYAFVYNPNPKYFDMSRVGYNADRIAHYLQYVFGDDEMAKAASANLVVNGAEWAEFEGVTCPSDLDSVKLSNDVAEWISRLAAVEREVAGGCKESATGMREVVKAARWMFDLSGWTDAKAQALRVPNPGTLFHHMAVKKAMLPLPLFAAYTQGCPLSAAQADPAVDEAGQLLEGIYGRIAEDGPSADASPAYAAFGVPAASHDPSFDDELDKLVGEAEEQFGLRCAVKRCSRAVLRDGMEPVVKESAAGERVVKMSAASLAEAYALYQAQALSDMARFGHPAGDVEMALLAGSSAAKN